MPHGLRDPLRRPVQPEVFVDTADVLKTQRQALAAHARQQASLDVSQGAADFVDMFGDRCRAKPRPRRLMGRAVAVRRLALLLVLLAAANAAAADPATGIGVEVPPGESRPVDLQGLFAPPMPLVDADGAAIVTRRAAGHPAVVDWDGDGDNDLLLGCHESMNTADAGILVLVNVGTAAAPRFAWPTTKRVVVTAADDAWPRVPSLTSEAGEAADSCSMLGGSCGCKSGGAFEVTPWDWNGDGRTDLIVDTFWKPHGVRVFLGGAADGRQTFTPGPVLWPIVHHGKGSGAGDWNNDGIPDYAHPVNRHEWTAHLGRRRPDGGVALDGETLRSADFTIVGHEAYRSDGRAAPWFAATPCAWNFSGRHGRDSMITEIVAVARHPDYDTTRDYAARKCDVNLYWLDRAARTCTRRATLAVNAAAATRLGLGDLDADGVMDLLCTGGTFNKDGAGTKIWWLRGLPAARTKGTRGPD